MGDVGYSILENILSPAECDSLSEALAGVTVSRGRGGTRNLMSNPVVLNLAHDTRLLHIAKMTLSTDAAPFRATLFDKSGNSNWHVIWHQDRALPLAERTASVEWGPWSTKSGVLYALAPAWALDRIVALRVHLDHSTNDNGPLRVIPGSHKAGVLSGKEILRATNSIPSQTCVVGPGGVLAMRPLLVHSSTKSRDSRPRRVLHIEYASDLQVGNSMRLRVT
jgi:ectoine hydroxylase-related dioxygenase (phytanoyl-CoA dioxygenase family)